jgi:erythromycin esterase-like protein
MTGGPRQVLRSMARTLTGGPHDYDDLLEAIGQASFVLLGEASHGTHEFYRERAVITRRLIEEKGFCAVAVEADWPDAYRVNRFVRGRGRDASARAALDGFQRFPAWMWRNTEVLEFVAWLRAHNRRMPADRCVGFYGLDLYSLHSSIGVVLGYLDRVDPAAARQARVRYGCFDHAGGDPQSYGYMTRLDLARSCEDGVVRQLAELLERGHAYAAADGASAEEDFFDATLNARVVRAAEEYYRTMFRSHVESWNLRDRHMMDALAALANHLGRDAQRPRIVVWAHNSHLGDARATSMSSLGELNLGQLVRERYAHDAFSVGFSTYSGTVTAAHEWDAAAETMRVRPGLEGSYEALFHEAGVPAFMVDLREHARESLLDGPLLQRAIGVIYRPRTERASHYFDADLPRQFDALLHFDETRAVAPLEHAARALPAAEAETFPSGV